MYQILLFIHVLIAFFIIVLVLVQQGKGATVGAAFGSGASQTVFGSRGSGSFLFRFTLGLGIFFFLTSIALNHMVTDSFKQEKMNPIPRLPASQTPYVPAQLPATLDSAKSAPTLPVEVPAKKN